MTKLRWIALFIWVSQAPATAVPGDINRDGKVDFADFFILAENFGKTGPPETDCEPIGGDEEPTVQDSVYVEQATNDSLNETSQDSEQTPADSIHVEGTLTDTTVETRIDTVE